MNKYDFTIKLSEALNYPIEKCELIMEVLEKNFFISQKNKDLIVRELSTKLEVSMDEALYIEEVAMDIFKKALKDKIKHPFRSLD